MWDQVIRRGEIGNPEGGMFVHSVGASRACGASFASLRRVVYIVKGSTHRPMSYNRNQSGNYYRPSFFGGFSFFPPVIKALLISNIGVYLGIMFLGNFHIGDISLYMVFNEWFALMPRAVATGHGGSVRARSRRWSRRLRRCSAPMGARRYHPSVWPSGPTICWT